LLACLSCTITNRINTESTDQLSEDRKKGRAFFDGHLKRESDTLRETVQKIEDLFAPFFILWAFLAAYPNNPDGAV
jgi:hypothetical protein